MTSSSRMPGPQVFPHCPPFEAACCRALGLYANFSFVAPTIELAKSELETCVAFQAVANQVRPSPASAQRRLASQPPSTSAK
jgi:hypothetical protein